MPNKSHNLDPRFENEIDADIVDVEVATVTSNGWANINSDYEHHLVVWAPFRVDGQLKGTTYNQNRKERVQTFVQKGDGNVNIGTEEWGGERIVLLILDEQIE